MEKYILSVTVQNNAGSSGPRIQPVWPPRLQHRLADRFGHD